MPVHSILDPIQVAPSPPQEKAIPAALTLKPENTPDAKSTAMPIILPDMQSELDKVNDVIEASLHTDVGLVDEMSHYLINAGGKRMRPLLVILAGFAGGYPRDGKERELFKLAAAVEFFHSATLLHDDVIDVSSLRRGRPTANATWGNASSILVGDFLYSRAFQMLISIGNIDVLRILADCANRIAEGEVFQLSKAGDPGATEDDYLRIVEAKTAILFSASARSGAALAGGSPQLQSALEKFGLCLGMAFQLMDDALDYSGSSDKLGKNVGDDLAEGKPTLPLLYVLKHGTDDEKQLVSDAIINKSAENLAAVVAVVSSSGALQSCTARAQEYVRQAQSALDVLEDDIIRQRLLRLATLAVERDN